MQQNKFLSTLGLARRAGKLSFGYDMVSENLHQTEMIFFASDLSERTRNSILQKAMRHGVVCRDIPMNMAEISYAIGTKPVGIVSIMDKGFADLLVKASEN